MAKQAQLVRSGANWFIWIAGLSLVNSVLFVAGSDWAFFLGLGATQFSDAFGKEIITGTAGEVVALVVDVVIAAIFVHCSSCIASRVRTNRTPCGVVSNSTVVATA